MLMELLSRDKDDEVRWNLAAGLHESVKILLPGEKAERLGKIVLSLLTDTHAAVTLNVLENFRETVEVFERGGCADIVSPAAQKGVYCQGKRVWNTSLRHVYCVLKPDWY